MHKGRLEAFSDGVFAIIITIMVLELKVPHGQNIEALLPLIPVFGSYVLSFVYVGIYWSNHHHMMQAVKSVNGSILWGNMHLLFWMSLVPFVTAWMGENNFGKWPVVCYGLVLFMNAVVYSVLSSLLIKHHGKDSTLAQAVKDDKKGKISIAFYLSAIGFSFLNPWIGFAFYIVVAIMWIVPDRRIERKVFEEEEKAGE